MEIYEVTVVKKGCNSLAKIKVVIAPQGISREKQLEMAKKYSTDQLVFVTPSEQAHCKFTFFTNSKEVLFCFIGFSAASHVLNKLYPNINNAKKYKFEAVDTIFTVDLMQQSLFGKDIEFINDIKSAISGNNLPYWPHSAENFNNYNYDYFLLEVPNFSPFVTRPANSKGIFQSTLVSFDELNNTIKTLLIYNEKQKYRMQIKYNKDYFDTMIFTLYIQNIENGHMLRIDAVSLEIVKLDAINAIA